jgi:hypothetical protein
MLLRPWIILADPRGRPDRAAAAVKPEDITSAAQRPTLQRRHTGNARNWQARGPSGGAEYPVASNVRVRNPACRDRSTPQGVGISPSPLEG